MNRLSFFVMSKTELVGSASAVLFKWAQENHVYIILKMFPSGLIFATKHKKITFRDIHLLMQRSPTKPIYGAVFTVSEIHGIPFRRKTVNADRRTPHGFTIIPCCS